MLRAFLTLRDLRLPGPQAGVQRRLADEQIEARARLRHAVGVEQAQGAQMFDLRAIRVCPPRLGREAQIGRCCGLELAQQGLGLREPRRVEIGEDQADVNVARHGQRLTAIAQRGLIERHGEIRAALELVGAGGGRQDVIRRRAPALDPGLIAREHVGVAAQGRQRHDLVVVQTARNRLPFRGIGLPGGRGLRLAVNKLCAQRGDTGVDRVQRRMACRALARALITLAHGPAQRLTKGLLGQLGRLEHAELGGVARHRVSRIGIARRRRAELGQQKGRRPIRVRMRRGQRAHRLIDGQGVQRLRSGLREGATHFQQCHLAGLAGPGILRQLLNRGIGLGEVALVDLPEGQLHAGIPILRRPRQPRLDGCALEFTVCLVPRGGRGRGQRIGRQCRRPQAPCGCHGGCRVPGLPGGDDEIGRHAPALVGHGDRGLPSPQDRHGLAPRALARAHVGDQGIVGRGVVIRRCCQAGAGAQRQRQSQPEIPRASLIFCVVRNLAPVLRPALHRGPYGLGHRL
ncbi:hypothetical protein [Verticiella alkaliphila]|uniref:hypothetical protein n=1 Tax=Verticiella alkaliphila TaxID=2779529 RepID=UPI003530255B